MTIRLEGDTIRVEDMAAVEEAETLFVLLQDKPRAVDLAACTGLHSAVVQVMIAAQAQLIGAPADPFVREALMPAIAAAVRRREAGQALALKLNQVPDGAAPAAPRLRS